jgi:hypothetical protein
VSLRVACCTLQGNSCTCQALVLASAAGNTLQQGVWAASARTPWHGQTWGTGWMPMCVVVSYGCMMPSVL